MRAKQYSQILGFDALRLCAGTVIAILVVILYDIISKGCGVINWTFLTSAPKNGMTEGGIFPAIIGTFSVTVITAVMAIPMGMGCAIYLNEYARDTLITRLIRMAIRNLSGVPSIVYGLFGVILFVQMMNLGTCILSACSFCCPILSLLPSGREPQRSYISRDFTSFSGHSQNQICLRSCSLLLFFSQGADSGEPIIRPFI